MKYCEMAGLSYDIEALNETYDDVKHDIETKRGLCSVYGQRAYRCGSYRAAGQ